jgi:hypothetical protein
MFTLRAYRSSADSGHVNVHVGYLHTANDDDDDVYSIPAPARDIHTDCFQIYPGGNDSKTFFDAFPARTQLHALYTDDAGTAHHMAHIVSHDQYIYFKLPAAARIIYVTFAASVKAAIEKIT